MKRPPGLTLAVTALATGVFLSGRLTGLASYLREEVLAGQWWRLFTGSFAHYDGFHLAANLLVVVTLGALAESWFPRGYPVALLSSLAASGAAAHYLPPYVAEYRGLSGVAVALCAFAATSGIRSARPSAAFWALLALVVAKTGAELFFNFSLTQQAAEHFSTLPLVHVVGLLAGVSAATLPTKKTPLPPDEPAPSDRHP